MRKIIMIIVILIAFCLGTQWGEMKGEFRSNRFERGGMMNWGGNRFDNSYGAIPQKVTGEVTVDVSKTPVAPVTPAN